MVDTSLKAKYMLYLTPMALCTGMYAAAHGLWVLAFAEWALVASSLYYWSHHMCAWRRTVDMVVVQLSLATHLYFTLRYRSWNALNCYGLAMFSYIAGVYYNSYIAHAFVWMLGCIANVILITNLRVAYKI